MMGMMMMDQPDKACVNNGVLLLGVSCPLGSSTVKQRTQSNTFYHHLVSVGGRSTSLNNIKLNGVGD
jgi:hypothetical protein